MLLWSTLVLGVFLCAAAESSAQPRVGALAIDERQGDQYGWAVDYEMGVGAREVALRECGAGCSVVLTFGRCGAYAADQDADSTAAGWAESYASAESARQTALAECRARGGPGCVIRAWGCNGHVVEEALGLDWAARRRIQVGLRSAGFDPGVPDGLFGSRTRAAIRSWQSARGARTTGYLDSSAVDALRSAGGSSALTAATAGVSRALPVPAAQDPASAGQPSSVPATTAQLEGLFWQSIMNSTNPAEFEAYLEQFPNGLFRALAQTRLAALRSSGGGTSAAAASDTSSLSAAVFRPARTCAEIPRYSGMPYLEGCWQELSQPAGCHVWHPVRLVHETVSWTGDCMGGLAQGAGTLTSVWDDGRATETGRFVDGKKNGHWVERGSDGWHGEGPYADGKQHGRWVLRFPNGAVGEGLIVNGERHGRWLRTLDGNAREELYRNGRRVR